jgi:hypothetical protein
MLLLPSRPSSLTLLLSFPPLPFHPPLHPPSVLPLLHSFVRSIAALSLASLSRSPFICRPSFFFTNHDHAFPFIVGSLLTNHFPGGIVLVLFSFCSSQ